MARKKPARTVRKAAAAQPFPIERLAWLVLLGIVAIVSAYVALSRLETVRVPAAVVQAQVIALTNDERVANDVGTLEESAVLDQAAQAKANDMAAKGYFSHVSPDGTVPWAWFQKFGYDYHYAGENLAVRFSDSKEVVDAWMASPTHKANIVKPQYTQIGIGVADGTYQGQPATFVVQFFGTPQPGSDMQASKPAVAKSVPAVPQTSAAKPTVAGAETSVPVQTSSAPSSALHVSLIDRIAGFFASAWRSLTANADDAGGVVVASGASTER